VFLVSFIITRKNVDQRIASALAESLAQMGRCYPSRIGSFTRNALQGDITRMTVGSNKALSSYLQRLGMFLSTITISCPCTNTL
jgi:hypothetical protein